MEGIMQKDEEKAKLAKKIAKGKIDFIKHLATYCFVMIILAVINNLTDPGGGQWWVWPAAIWGIFVVINFLKVFVFKESSLKRYEEKIAQRELEKMKSEE
jgi:short subunit fatty acids transporter